MWNTTRTIKIETNPDAPLSIFRQTIHGGSISGAQKKGLFELNKGVLSPSPNGDFILKPPGDYDFLPENEHATMSIAKALRFSVPPFALFHQEQLGNILAIKRFDFTSDNQHLRIEDFAQILDQASSDKYNLSCEQLAKGIKQYSSNPVADCFELWRRLLFAFFTGNGDMHLKNWSLLELDSMQGIFKLSPCYDFLNTRLSLGKEEPCDLALPLQGKRKKISKNVFDEFAKKLKMAPPLVKETFSQLDHWMEITEDIIPRSLLPDREKERYLEIARSRYKLLRGKTNSYF